MENQASQVVTRELQIREISAELKEKRQAEFVISSEAVDSYGTVFRADGWDLTRYNNNPVVLYGHRSFDGNPDFVIGIGEVFREGNDLIGRVTFENEADNPLAEKVFRKVQNGTLRMASIGANPTKGHFGVEKAGENPEVLYFDRQELLEFSIVPIGSNPDALKRSAEAIDNFKQDIKARNIEVKDKDVVEPQSKDKKLLTVREAQLKINKSKNVQ